MPHVGDVNWRENYREPYALWELAQHGGTVLQGGSAPARCETHGGVAPRFVKCTAVPGVVVLSAAVAQEERGTQRRRGRLWRIAFYGESSRPDTFREAARVFRPMMPSATVTSEEMWEQWAPVWAPERDGHVLEQARKDAAQEEAFRQDMVPQAWSEPNFEDFLSVLGGATGSAGLDGWSSPEVKAMAKHMPFVL